MNPWLDLSEEGGRRGLERNTGVKTESAKRHKLSPPRKFRGSRIFKKKATGEGSTGENSGWVFL